MGTHEKPQLGLGLWCAGLLDYGGLAAEVRARQRALAHGGGARDSGRGHTAVAAWAASMGAWQRARLRWAALVARVAVEALDAAVLGHGHRTARTGTDAVLGEEAALGITMRVRLGQKAAAD
jgi:hypothetical protein